MSGRTGIYVEVTMRATLDQVWDLTQKPELHQRWDLRFTRINYLPRLVEDEAQQFLYETRIGLGLSLKGTGETVGQRVSAEGDTTSALKFASEDPKSLIRVGSGYWRYVPAHSGLRFFTWYDYTVRWGVVGRFADRLVLRPLIGWATAWSFDRLRLWAEKGQSPEASLAFAQAHAVARIAIAGIWIWHGLVPKLLYHQIDERTMLTQAGVPLTLLPWIGGAEILFGMLMLALWTRRRLFLLNAVAMMLATVAVAVHSPAYLTAAFNPVTLNIAMIALSVVGWITSRSMPSASRCLRTAPRGQA